GNRRDRRHRASSPESERQTNFTAEDACRIAKIATIANSHGKKLSFLAMSAILTIAKSHPIAGHPNDSEIAKQLLRPEIKNPLLQFLQEGVRLVIENFTVAAASEPEAARWAE